MEAPIVGQCDSLSKVDSCLSDLYMRAVGEEAAAPTVKTVLFNLVVFATTEKIADRAMLDVTDILATHPCRAIVADVARSGKGEEGASVSVMCGITERGDRRLCGEIISLHAHNNGSAIVGAVMPLLIPDIPVFLWIPGDVPRESEEFNDFVRASSHLIFDSRAFTDLGQGDKLVRRLGSADGSNRIVQDLAWISLMPWRELTAQHFDAPSTRPYLSRITQVTVRYASGERSDLPASAPLLLALWLMERTQMRFISAFRSRDQGFRIAAEQGDHDVELRFIPEVSGFGPGRLISVRIQCGTEEGSATFTTQGISENELTLTEECVGVCLPPKLLELPAQDESALAGQALDSYRRDRVFEQVLDVALAVIDYLEAADEKLLRLRL